MPPMRIDILEGHTVSELESLRDAAHDAMLTAFGGRAGHRTLSTIDHMP
ncbi:hypothetical protein G3T14_14565 [Methylobacterium sp. BTF04]|nr:hypothetical protein [Methylobacterium sp. BTF04]NEU13344.1 hypothetical protein [Methylobacterium sp. BTF04]